MGAPAGAGVGTATGSGSGVVAAAESQVGQAEQPPGSNDGPAIAMYRNSVAGAQPGEPWCAYFASWAAAQAGTPLGDAGAGARLGRRDHRLGPAHRPLPSRRVDPAARRPDPLRRPARRHRRVGQPRRVAHDRRGQLRPGRQPRQPDAERGHRLRAAVGLYYPRRPLRWRNARWCARALALRFPLARSVSRLCRLTARCPDRCGPRPHRSGAVPRVVVLVVSASDRCGRGQLQPGLRAARSGGAGSLAERAESGALAHARRRRACASAAGEAGEGRTSRGRVSGPDSVVPLCCLRC